MSTTQKKTLYQTIADELRREIEDHRHAGDFLESERVLAKRFSVNPRTVAKAMDILCSEGRISRQTGKGTVVSDPVKTGGFVIYTDASLLAPTASAFYRTSCQVLSRLLHEFNPRWQTRIYLGPESPASPIPAEDVGDGDMYNKRTRGIFSFISADTLPEDLRDSTIPVVWLSAWAGQHRVNLDYAAFFREAVECFRKTAHQRIGLIWSYSENRARVGDCHDRMFREEVHDNGMETRKDWMPACQQDDTSELAGYELFRKLWEQKDRPDALLVSDDFLCRGVLAAIRDCGVKVPSQLSLISLANKGSSIPYYKPITTLEVDHVEIARALLNMMITLVRGETLEEDIVQVQPHLCVGETVRNDATQTLDADKEVSGV